MEGNAFPTSNERDGEQVATALDTASALWTQGDAREALRWLRRAAEAAGEAGDDWRAVQLARAAADLANELQIPPSLVQASIAPLPSPRSQPSHAAPSLPAHSQPVHPRPIASQPGPLSQRGTQAGPRPQPPRRNSEPGDVVTSAPSLGHAGPDTSLRPTAVTSPRPRQALHVAVQPSDEDRNLLYVRILAEGEALPPGSHAALLVALEPQTNLLLRKR